MDVIEMCKLAKKASRKMAGLSSKTKNDALLLMGEALIKNKEKILVENSKDVEAATANGLPKPLIDRLLLTESRIYDMAKGLENVATLTDPIGEVTSMVKRPNGLEIAKKRAPLGVIAMIYEARPNVTVDAAGLCLKTGNVTILKGGSDAINSNRIISEVISVAAVEAGLPEGCINFIDSTDREITNTIMKLNEYVDVIIPRGGAKLIQYVVKNSTVPVIETGIGNCHIYVEESADFDMAEKIVVNAKTSRPGVCNAAEKLLVDEKIAKDFLPKVLASLEALGVEIRGCEKTKAIYEKAKDTTLEDWGTEYLDYIIGVKVVKDVDEAVEHINTYGSGHSEAIVTNDYKNSRKFLDEVDAAAVYVNASTRFTDGSEFGFGAEIGISTQKLHARGPMGLEQLTTTKYVIFGEGQIR